MSSVGEVTEKIATLILDEASVVASSPSRGTSPIADSKLFQEAIKEIGELPGRKKRTISFNSASGKAAELIDNIRQALDEGHLDEAITDALNIPADADNGKSLHNGLQMCRDACLSQGAIKKAIEVVEKTPFAFDGHDHRRNGYVACVNALVADFKFEEAQARACDTRSYAVCRAYVQRCLELNKPDKACEILGHSKERWPNKSHFFYEIIRYYITCKENKKAYEVLKATPTNATDSKIRDEYLEKLANRFLRSAKDKEKALEAAYLISETTLRQTYVEKCQSAASVSASTETDSD